VYTEEGLALRRKRPFACSSLFLEMLVATYVHLQPGVPPEVLPLGIKPPVIPFFVVLLGVIVAIPAWKASQTELAVETRRPASGR
jgi:hypothetical protein